MIKVDIFSGFLGAGKTTLIKKLVKESFQGQKIVLIENEFGEIGIDSSFLKESGIQINELNDGCICCSLVGDFREALKKVVKQYNPDRIIIEPSGVGKLSDVTRAVEGVAEEAGLELNSFVTVADVKKVKMYMKNFGEFYDDQISHASCIILSRTQMVDETAIKSAVDMIRTKNEKATVITTDWNLLPGDKILSVMDGKNTLVDELTALAKEANANAHDEDDDEDEHEHHHHHHHDHDEDEEELEHHHHHDDDDDDDDEDEHEHHHHDHDDDDDDEDEHEHHHHHDDDDDDEDEHHHHHHHHHHHDHDADEIFTSWGVETSNKFTKSDIEKAIAELETGKYGTILRSKGIVDGGSVWYEFDMVPGEIEIRETTPDVTGKLVVIGSKLDEAGVAKLFNV